MSIFCDPKRRPGRRPTQTESGLPANLRRLYDANLLQPSDNGARNEPLVSWLSDCG